MRELTKRSRAHEGKAIFTRQRVSLSVSRLFIFCARRLLLERVYIYDEQRRYSQVQISPLKLRRFRAGLTTRQKPGSSRPRRPVLLLLNTPERDVISLARGKVSLSLSLAPHVSFRLV